MKFSRILTLVAVLAAAMTAAAQGTLPEQPLSYLEALDSFTQLERTSHRSPRAVRNYLVPLGAIEKVRGVWAPRDAVRRSGTLQRYTWQVLDGFTSAEMMGELEQMLAADDRAALQFACEARACGSSVQWANRIFQERLLYGTEKSQRYRVYTISTPQAHFSLLIYASARTADRQYLHAELLRSDAPAAASEDGGSALSG